MMDSSSCRHSVSRVFHYKCHKRFSDGRVSKKIMKIFNPPLSDDRALKLVREVTDADRCSTVGDTAVMCDLKRTTAQYIFKMGVQTLGMYSVWRRNF